jgi:hypothetical protein
VSVATRREVRAPDLGRGAVDDADTNFGVSRELDGNIAQKLIAITRRNRLGAVHDGRDWIAQLPPAR